MWQRFPIKGPFTAQDHILSCYIWVEKKGEEEKLLIFGFEKLLIFEKEEEEEKSLILDFEKFLIVDFKKFVDSEKN